jgi:hypothetical protein
MLQVQGNKVGVPVHLLVPDFFPSEKALYQKLWRDKKLNYGMKRLQRGCYGNSLLVDFDTLDKKVQEQIGDPRKPDHLLDNYYEVDTEAVEFYHNWQYPDGSYLKPDSIEQYIINASVMKAIFRLRDARIAERQSKNGSLQGITQTLCTDANTYQEHLQAKAGMRHKLPTNARRFKQAMTEFERIGFISLIKDAKGNAKKNAAKVDEQVLQLLNDLFASQSHKPTATEVAGQYDAFLRGQLEVFNAETGEQYTTDGYASISTSTVKRYLTQWQSRIATHHVRSGDRQKYMNKYSVHHSLKQPEFAGEIISIDDRQPPFEYEPGKRMWWYLGVDLGSEAITTWVHGKSKEGIILDFYQQMVRNYHEWGMPLPYELEAESSLNSSFKETFLREGQMFSRVRIEANKARAKRIEAYFRQLRYGIEKKREGWLARPFAGSESNQLGGTKKTIIPYDELVHQCLLDIMTWNNMEHSKIKGKTRWEVFLERQHPELKPINLRAILPALGHSTATSVNVGIIRFKSREWLLGVDGQVATGDTLIRLMKGVEGEDITIHWLDNTDGSVMKAYIYHNERYVCEAVPKPVYSRSTIGRTDADVEARAIMSAYANTVDGYRKETVKGLNKVAVLDNRSLTLNDKFQIPGMAKHRPAEQEPQEAEVLPELPEEEDYSTPIQTSFKQSLKDRF